MIGRLMPVKYLMAQGRGGIGIQPTCASSETNTRCLAPVCSCSVYLSCRKTTVVTATKHCHLIQSPFVFSFSFHFFTSFHLSVPISHPSFHVWRCILTHLHLWFTSSTTTLSPFLPPLPMCSLHPAPLYGELSSYHRPLCVNVCCVYSMCVHFFVYISV